MATKARKRMDKLMRHLTCDAPADFPAENDTTGRLRLRRELASSQRERVLNDFGYELKDQEHESLFALEEYLETCEDDQDVPFETQEENIIPTPLPTFKTLLDETRSSLSRACNIAARLDVAGNALEDCASCFVPGFGHLVKPMGMRFNEVTPQGLLLLPLKDLPNLHGDLHRVNRTRQLSTTAPNTFPLCIFSAKNDDCELIAITKDGFLPLCQDALRVYGAVHRADEENLELRAARTAYSDVSCWLIKNRGAVCSARSVEAALANLIWTVRACAFQVKSLQAVGGNLARLDVMSHGDALKAKSELQLRCSNDTVITHMFNSL